jgi:hypothetical protein
LALKRRLPKIGGGCCCGGGGGNVTCGVPCSACGGVTILNGGYVDDANGRHPLSFGGLSWGTGIISWTSHQCFVADGYCNLIGIGDGTVTYGYVVSCVSGLILFGIQVDPPITSANIPGCTPGFDINFCGESGVGYTAVTGATVCGGAAITKMLTSIASVNTGCGTVTMPTSSATLYLPVESPRPQICCQPCPIPKTTLTLTVDGGAGISLPFDGTSTWTNGTYTLDCHLGNIRLQGPLGPWTAETSTLSCLPLHQRFASGIHGAIIDE